MNLTLIIFMLASYMRFFQLLLKVENLFASLILLLFCSVFFFVLYLRGLYKLSYIFLFTFVSSIILGPEIINSITEKGQLGWYDEIDGQIGFALTEGTITKGFNHFWAGGTPYNHGFNVGNLPLYFAKGLNISIYLKILFVKILYWFLALGIPITIFYKFKKNLVNNYLNNVNFLVNILLIVLAIINITEFHGWIFTRGFLGPLLIIYITFMRSNGKRDNFYIFLFSIFIYIFGSFLIPSFINGGLRALFIIALINFIDFIKLKEFPKNSFHKSATILVLFIISLIIIFQIFTLREINFQDFSRSIRVNYPSFNDIFISLFGNPSFNAVLGSICLLGLNNKFLRLRSFLYIIIPITLTFSLSFIFSNFELDFDLYNKLKVLRPNIFLSSINFFLLDLILLKFRNNFKFKKLL